MPDYWEKRLLEPRFAHHVEAEGTVFIAQSDHGEFAVDRIFDLNHLILSGGDVCDVGDHQAARHLLLDGNAGNRVLLGVERGHGRADAEMADPKKALNAPAKLAG